MCGITGFWDLRAARSTDQSRDVVRAMMTAIAHRGPDDTGEFVDAERGVALGFRRLSILDLSPAGHQPMASATGRYVIIFNGEVYNYEDVRRDLIEAGVAPSFRGHSDTEVILAAIEAWGLGAIERFIGMFAAAVWDRQERELTLIRDRVGVKPLYYGWAGDVLLFGSELKAIRQHPAFAAEISRDALAQYARYLYVPAPFTIYEGIEKLEPGTFATFRAHERTPRETAYWSARRVVEKAASDRVDMSEEEAIDALDVLVRDAVRLRMIADVPLGAFLSGGIDSSTVVAAMQAQSSLPVRTFTIGFHEQRYNEAHFAARVARHLGTDHSELYVTAEEAMATIPRMPGMYDEPFADSSQIPTFLVSQLARRHVKVSLSGDGGDELFGGYYRYVFGRAMWRNIGRVPRPFRRTLGRLLMRPSARTWERVLRAGGPLVPSLLRQERPGEKLHKAAHFLAASSTEKLYEQVVTHWSNVVRGARDRATIVTDSSQWPALDDPTERMMYLDLMTYLPDDVLVKVDRASMAVSLEAREPLLDHRLIEFAWRLPMRMKLGRDRGKVILRKLLRRYLPEELIERPKMGFGVPIADWLRGPLRGWAEDLLDEAKMRDAGYFDAEQVRNVWAAHLRGEGNWQDHLWAVLMFEAWRRESAALISAEPAATGVVAV